MHLSEKYKIVQTGGRTFALFASRDSEDGFRPFVINETGARLLALLKQDRSMDDLLAVLAEEYRVDEAALRRDVEGYLARLAAFGILAGDGAPPPGEHNA